MVDPAEVDDDLVRDVTGLLTSLCARLYRIPVLFEVSGERYFSCWSTLIKENPRASENKARRKNLVKGASGE